MARADAKIRPAPGKAVMTATRYAGGRLGLGGISAVKGRRSTRRSAWALVTGRYRWPGNGGRFAVWVRFVDGYWIVQHAGVDEAAAEPPDSLRVPCDLRPAFGKPAC
ncbi:MAG: hypothetical protein U0R69_12380 [Gaiellales bacterium]